MRNDLSRLDQILSKWVRLGATFNVSPSPKTPDVERLIMETVAEIPHFSRLKSMMTAWLMQFEELVCRHRLANLIKAEANDMDSAILGYVLSSLRSRTKTSHFNMAIKQTRALSCPVPMYKVDQKNSATAAFAERFSDHLAKSWGLWAPEDRDYVDSLMSVKWVMKENPQLRYRALFSGKLQATIISNLLENPSHGQSESVLAHACAATRVSIRKALEHLELCGYVERKPDRRAVKIQLLNVDGLLVS